ncbi:MAG: hypothetical protein AVDCRST_MAG23-301, partial [uncultured Sphingosinicella sp.]
VDQCCNPIAPDRHRDLRDRRHGGAARRLAGGPRRAAARADRCHHRL